MPRSYEEQEALRRALSEKELAVRSDAQEQVRELERIKSFITGNTPGSNERREYYQDQIDSINMEMAARLRLFELERRMLSRESGNSYRPDFEGIVTGTFLGIDQSGAAFVLYKGKKYKTIRKGTTSLRKGELVQMFFSGNSYYADWS